MNYYVDKILKETTITSFLENRGIFPVRKSADKLFYLCPVHSGDKVPSFVVYPVGTNGRDYQTYHCFGCHSGINLINLKRDLDHISPREALRYFLKDIIIDEEGAIDSNIDSWDDDEILMEDQKEIENILLQINYACKEHFVVCNDEEEKDFFNIFFKQVDEIARSRNLETMKGILEILIDRGGLERRTDRFNERQDKKNLSALNWRM